MLSWKRWLALRRCSPPTFSSVQFGDSLRCRRRNRDPLRYLKGVLAQHVQVVAFGIDDEERNVSLSGRVLRHERR